MTSTLTQKTDRERRIWEGEGQVANIFLLLFSRSVVSSASWPHGQQHTRLPCPSPPPGVCPSSCPLHRWYHPTISSSVTLFSCLQSFHAFWVFSNELALRIRWPKYWSFSFSISPSYEYSGLISSKTDWLDLLAVQGTLKSLLQHDSAKASEFKSINSSAIPMYMYTHTYIQYVSKFGKLSSGHRTRKGQFSLQSQRKTMPKNVQTTMQLSSFHIGARLCSKSFKLDFSSTWTENFQMYKLDLEKSEEPEVKLTTFVGSLKKQKSSRKIPTSALLTMAKPLTVWITTNCGEFLKRWKYQTTWPASWEIWALLY